MEEQKHYSVPSDVITLPSLGLLYENGEDVIEVFHMTPEDENIMTSPNLLQTGKFIDVLLERKIKSKWIKPKDLHSGDRNAILNFLRVTAYGGDYHVELEDPQTGELFSTKVDLSKLEYKNIPEDANFDKETRTFSYVLNDEIKKKEFNIVFKLLSSQEEEMLIKNSELALKKASKIFDSGQTSQISSIFMDRLIARTVSINGITDKSEITKIMKYNISNKASREYSKHVVYCTPDVDYTYELEAPSGGRFRFDIPISISEYFFPV